MIKTRTKLQLISRPPVDRDRYENSTNVAALQGNLAVVPVFDVIQWVCSSRQSWIVTLLKQGVDASVTIAEGELVDARWGALFGPAALVEIVACNQGFFELRPIASELHRSLRGNWHVVLLDSVQQLDELRGASRERSSQARDLGPEASTSSGQSGQHRLSEIPRKSSRATLPSSHASPAKHGESAPDADAGNRQAAAQLIDRGFAAVREGDSERARQLWQQALTHDPSNRALQFNLRKLDAKTNSNQ